ncbi:MAG: DUF6502 family protein [Pseudomonadota bacterium]
MLTLLDSLLSSLARLLVARGVAFPDFSERMKSHYLKAARDLADGKETASRLSVMTGLQRRDIARIAAAKTEARPANHMARLVALWQSAPGYQENGAPMPLPKNGPAPSFEALVRMVRKDVHARSILDTLEQAGTVQVDPAKNTIELVEMSYQPLPGSDAQVTYLAHNAGDHLAAAAENVRGRTPPFFERAVHYSGLTDAQVAELEHDFREEEMAVLRRLNEKAGRMAGVAAGKGTQRFRAGGYFYHRSEDKE